MVSNRVEQGQDECPEPVSADRLRLLKATDIDQSVEATLLCAIQHSVAELGGLGGMVHLSGLDFHWARLLLASSSGLPPTIARMWQHVPRDSSTVLGRAFHDRGKAWLPSLGGLGPTRDAQVAAPLASELPSDAGIAAVAVPGRDGPLGVLSVMTRAGDEPIGSQWSFFTDVAGWVAARLRLLPSPEQGGLTPTLFGRGQQPADKESKTQAGAVGDWEWDLATGEFIIDERVLDALGINPEGFDGRVDTWLARQHPDDLTWAMRTIKHLVPSRLPADYEYRVCGDDGSYSWVRMSIRTTRETADGEPIRKGGSMTITTATHEVAESMSLALRNMSDGFLSVARDGLVQWENLAAERLFGPFHEVVSRPLWEVPAVQQVPELAEDLRRAVIDQTPVDINDLQWPDSMRRYQARVYPTPGGGATVYVADITEKRLREAAERAAMERETLAADLTRALAQARTAPAVIAAVAETLLPALGASGLAVLTLDRDRLRLLGSAGYPPEFRQRMHDFPLGVHTPSRQVLRTGIPLFIGSPEEHARRFPEVSDLIDLGQKRAWAFLPLRVSGRPVGTAVVAYDRPHEPTQDERTLLTTISGLIAHAVEHANVYNAVIERASALQHALLPKRLPELPTMDIAARYRPAALPSLQPADIGGDWYDVIRLSGGRVALVSGDVMGHGTQEAATMGQLRTAVRTLSSRELPPGEILAHLNDIVVDMGEDSFATCLYGVYDPVGRTFTYASAGHPPPAHALSDGTVAFPGPPSHIRADGIVDFTKSLADPPLGAGTPPFETFTFDVPDGSLLVLYTDGLVEEPRRDIGEGMGRLARILHAEHTGDLPPLCDAIIDSLLPPGQPTSDDAALLIARTHPLHPEDIATWDLPERPEAASEARKHVRDQLTVWDLGDQLQLSSELVVSELVGNVIRHASGPTQLRLLHTDRLICEVSDNSLTTPQIRHPSLTAEGGRGLYLVAAMADRWGTRPTECGKTIWAELML
ncbi:SpoIIE family protein phosphatase [Streptomyces spiralis]